MNRKFCKDCGDYRPVEMFSKNARTKDGLAFYCREHLAVRSARSRELRRSKPRVQRRPPEDLVIPEGHEWCADCETVLPLTDFVRTAASRTGYGSYCKPCHNRRGRRALEKVGGSRTYHLTRRYGITAAEAEHMLKGQEGLCEICRAAPATQVDHDHVTGAVRALLCFNCNGGLGQFRDDPDVLLSAADYVRFHAMSQRVLAIAHAAGFDSVRAVRADRPLVGSRRRPEAPDTTVRSTGRTGRSRGRKTAGGSSGPD